MALFHKKEKKEVTTLPEIPSLPELPRLPEFNELNYDEPISKLPSFPKNSYGNRFSRDTIKEAVMGEKEDLEDSANDLGFNSGISMMPKPLTNLNNFSDKNRVLTREIDEDYNYKSSEFSKPERKIYPEKGPIFIRLDKFEEAQKIFDETKKDLKEISNLLEDTKEIKQKEEKTLQEWETELQNIKSRIDKVDRDIFSKI